MLFNKKRNVHEGSEPMESDPRTVKGKVTLDLNNVVGYVVYSRMKQEICDQSHTLHCNTFGIVLTC